MNGLAALLAAAVLYSSQALPAEERRAGAARLMDELMAGKDIGRPFILTDTRGKKTALADFRGRLVLLYFGYATCPDVCPTDLAIIGQALRGLGATAGQVQPVFITLDPLRDSAAVLREYATAFHPRMVALTGSESDIQRVATDFKVFYEKVKLPGGGYTIDHAAFTFLLDREGKYIGLFPPGTPPERMVAILREHLRPL